VYEALVAKAYTSKEAHLTLRWNDEWMSGGQEIAHLHGPE